MTKVAFNDDSFEQSFFQLAYNQLQDKIKKLNRFLIGFELVKKNEDNTKALGVFGFKSDNGQTLFVPVFFVNGAVKNIDLLYSKNNSQFYPLNDDFANLLLESDSSALGTKADQDSKKLKHQTHSTDLRDLVIPPRTGRYTYASETDSALLEYVKTGSIKTKHAFFKLMEKDADFMESVMRFYSTEKIAEALAVEPEAQSVKEQPVQVVTTQTLAGKELNEGQKEDLLTKGFVFIDKRKDEQKSKFAPIQFSQQFSTAAESGCYPYITARGSIEYGLILVCPQRFDVSLSTDDTIVLNLEGKNVGKAYIKEAKSVFIKDSAYVKDISAIHKDFDNLADLKPGYDNVYVLITENLKCTQPFRVTSNFKDASGSRRIIIQLYESNEYDHDYSDNGDCHPRPIGVSRPGSSHYLPQVNTLEVDKKKTHFTLIVTKNKSDKLSKVGNMVYVPGNWKALHLDFRSPDRDPMEGEYTEEKSKELDLKYDRARELWKSSCPGSKTTLFGSLRQNNIFPMTVRENGSIYYATLGDLKKKYNSNITAKIGMVLEFGLDEKQANELIDSLVPNVVKSGMCKVGYTGDMYGDVNWEEHPYADVTGVPTTSGIPYEQYMDSGLHNTEDYTQLGRGTRDDLDGEKAYDPPGIQDNVNHAVGMAQNGQKELFDTQSIATLAKYTTPDDKILTYVPDFVTALDRLGRILFLVNWDMDSFKNMYGRTDLPEFIDLTKNVFKNLGDLVVFLKKKKPDLSINMSESEALDA